jgi:hypothetical protein
MLTAQETTQNLQNVWVLAVLLATGVVLFWRTAIKLMIITAAVLLVTLMAAGAFTILETVHR